ncbi:hypothetical protein HNR39_003485 [Glaciimonas immobilis]|uniref:Uncharacterized protein n=1 Tax=Glaciimonas immobilis TaxID=728004 RepID=A0A840RWS4_9BURK|nr:hypothetical protein [Glaciimonas immobilis]
MLLWLFAAITVATIGERIEAYTPANLPTDVINNDNANIASYKLLRAPVATMMRFRIAPTSHVYRTYITHIHAHFAKLRTINRG